MASKEHLKTIVRGSYQIQKLRIQTGNRVVISFKNKIIALYKGKPEEFELPKGKDLLADLRYSYDKITDKITDNTVDNLPTRAKFKPHGLIMDYTDLVMMNQYVSLVKSEESHFKALKNTLADFPIYNKYFKDVNGMGPAMAGVIISEIDIEKSKYPSSIYRYAGLDVGPDGRGRGRYKEHLVDVEYVDKEGKTQTKKSITFNPFLKTKLVGVLGGSFLIHNEKYSKIYNDYKNRLENHAKYKDESKGHRHNMAIRRMIKLFINDMYNAWRKLEDLEVFPPYHVAKLGMSDHAPVELKKTA